MRSTHVNMTQFGLNSLVGKQMPMIHARVTCTVCLSFVGVLLGAWLNWVNFIF